LKVAFIIRATIYKVHGGITIQVVETAKHLKELGVNVHIFLANEKIDYNEFDLIHFFDITRPANILYHIMKTNKPVVLSPVLIDYSEYDKQHRNGFSGLLFRFFNAGANEYIKAVSRWILRKDGMQSKSYLWKGHNRSIHYILQKINMLLPNSQEEYNQLQKTYPFTKPYAIIPNGIDEKLFNAGIPCVKEERLVVCAARIEGIKNQLNLIKALHNSRFRLVLVGEATQNQKNYYRRCRQAAGNNITFTGRLSQEELVNYYRKAKVHVLPSWFETCGLSSLEAAAMGCNIVISDKGFVRDYFGDDAFYCQPGNMDSIYQAVSNAADSPSQKKLQEKILSNYTWRQAAVHTLEAYQKVLSGIKQ
jgi:glycosyltransferase involved in cell wall biosynthesis